MWAILICCGIVAVLLYIIGIYALVILYKINKLGQGSKELQTEFLAHRLKLFIAFTLISVVLSISLFVGYALLVTRYDTNQISELYLFFILFSWFFSLLSIITFVTGFITQKLRNKGNKQQKDKAVKQNPAKVINTNSNTQEQEKFMGKEIIVQNNEQADKTLGKELVTGEADEYTAFNTDWFWKYEQKKREEQEKIEREKIEQEKYEKLWLDWKMETNDVLAEKEIQRQSLKCLEESSLDLVKKYAQSVKNFIEKMEEVVGCPFLGMFKDSIIPLSSILVYPYRNSNSQLLIDKIKKDGLKFTFSDNEKLNNKIQKLTDFFIAGLKKRIKDNNEWQDDFTFPALLYLIVRNNVIKYYHDEYLKYFGYEDLEEFCKKIPNGITDAENTVPIISKINIFSKKLASNARMYYVYYYIYITDINLPFVDTYTTICEKINTIYEELKAQKLENDLFGNPQKKSVLAEQTADNIKPTTIERVDTMSGAEFELFMTQYFINQGFKTTHTPISGDYGIDLIIENDFGKIGVQAKCYSNKVSLDAVQQVVAGLRHYGLSSGIVITNNYFQPSAIRLAADNNITLWDRDKLIEKLGK